MKKKVENQYLANKINTATPLELVIIAYEGAINFLKEAKNSYEHKNIQGGGDSIIKSQKIIRELRNSLDMEVKDVSENLFFLYRQMDKNLTAVAKSKHLILLNRVISMLDELKNSWVSISKNAASLETAQKRPVHDAQYVNTYR